MKGTVTAQGSVESDGRTVWVHTSDGCCVGRFSRSGIDVHYEMKTQLDLGVVCLDCKAGPTDLADWERFRKGIWEFYQIYVTEAHKPRFLRDG